MRLPIPPFLHIGTGERSRTSKIQFLRLPSMPIRVHRLGCRHSVHDALTSREDSTGEFGKLSKYSFGVSDRAHRVVLRAKQSTPAWSGRVDSNHRPQTYQVCALTNCATSRYNKAEKNGAAYGKAFAVIRLILFFCFSLLTFYIYYIIIFIESQNSSVQFPPILVNSTIFIILINFAILFPALTHTLVCSLFEFNTTCTAAR